MIKKLIFSIDENKIFAQVDSLKMEQSIIFCRTNLDCDKSPPAPAPSPLPPPPSCAGRLLPAPSSMRARCRPDTGRKT